MDGQLKRGMLDVCVLAAIRKEDSYGYQILKDLRPYVALSESTLYPILRRLETAEMLTVRTVEHNGRLRKYYHLTPQGLARIEQFKTEWGDVYKRQILKLSLSARSADGPLLVEGAFYAERDSFDADVDIAAGGMQDARRAGAGARHIDLTADRAGRDGTRHGDCLLYTSRCV